MSIISHIYENVNTVEQKKESIFWTYFDENDGSDDGKSGPAEGRKPRDGTA